MTQSCSTLLNGIAHEVVATTSEQEATKIKRLIGAAMASLHEIDLIFYDQHIETVPKGMWPPGVETHDALRPYVDRWVAAFKRLEG